jgi:hypothetical protein
LLVKLRPPAGHRIRVEGSISHEIEQWQLEQFIDRW